MIYTANCYTQGETDMLLVGTSILILNTQLVQFTSNLINMHGNLHKTFSLRDQFDDRCEANVSITALIRKLFIYAIYINTLLLHCPESIMSALATVSRWRMGRPLYQQ
jgi:hypothetical protein